MKTTKILLTTAVMAMATASFVAQYGGSTSNPVIPVVTAPTQNQITTDKAVLGKILFWEEQLSNDNSMACGTCHRAEAGGADPRVLQDGARHPGMDGTFGTTDDRSGSPGIISAMPQGNHVADGVFYPRVQVTGRRAPSAFDAAFSSSLFWDGRADDVFKDQAGNIIIPSGAALENLALQPLLNQAEMGCLQRTVPQIVAKLQASAPLALATNLTPDITAAIAANPTYVGLFNAAFGSPVITAERMAMALATYMRTLSSNQTPFDAFVAGNNGSLFVSPGAQPVGMTPSQVAGMNVFNNRCVACHAMPMFAPSTVENAFFGGVFNGSTTEPFAVSGLNDPNEDPGRYFITNAIGDFGKVKTPSLRNVGVREPFGLTRTGRYDTLEAIVNSYAQGGTFTLNLPAVITNLGSQFTPLAPMTAVEKTNLVDFLRNALTDPRVAQSLPPFDRPTLASETGVVPTLIGDGTNGLGGFEPKAAVTQPPALGTYSYTVGVGEGIGGSVAVLALNTIPAAPGSTYNGVPVYVGTAVPPILVTVGLQGQGAGEGFGSLTFPIPANPSLANFSLYGQWFVVDPSTAAGVSATTGFQMTLF